MIAVDLFSGFGGASEGMRQAGIRVAWAANHNPLAVQVHAANHPETTHVCQDLHQADWTTLPPFDLLWGSPACQGHSTCAQPNPTAYHDDMRGTAWSIVHCADVTNPRAIVVENVLKMRKWRLYGAWCQALKDLGYNLQEHLLTATDHGVPQRRTRLFVVALRNQRKLHFPFALKSEPAFEPCLQDDASGWQSIGEAGPDSAERMRLAAQRFKRSLVQHVTGHRGIPLYEPIRTITTKAQWCLVERNRSGGRYRWLTPRELARGMGFPDSFTWPDGLRLEDVKRGIGNAVPPPMSRDIVAAVREAA